MSRTPINSLADFKGKKVRSFGGAIDRFLRDTFNEAATKRGVKDPQAIGNKYGELVGKYEKLFEGKRSNPEALYEIMRREVYDKLDPAKF